MCIYTQCVGGQHWDSKQVNTGPENFQKVGWGWWEELGTEISRVDMSEQK